MKRNGFFTDNPKLIIHSTHFACIPSFSELLSLTSASWQRLMQPPRMCFTLTPKSLIPLTTESSILHEYMSKQDKWHHCLLGTFNIWLQLYIQPIQHYFIIHPCILLMGKKCLLWIGRKLKTT